MRAFAVDLDEIWIVSHADSRASLRIRAVTQWIADMFAELAPELSGAAAEPPAATPAT